MIWHYINTGFNTGRYNMEYDLHLAGICAGDEAYLRLYRWEPYCISLGANQPFDSIKEEKAKEDGIDIVKRPTGGRAILHAEEITYSVIYPLGKDSSAKNIYTEINNALLTALSIYDRQLVDAGLENMEPNFPSFYKEEISTLCFAASAKSEVKYSGKKLIGSAQRKLSNVILQHGSILCGGFHRNIVKYLNVKEDTTAQAVDLMSAKTTDIESILGSAVDYEKLAGCIRSGFEQYYSMAFAGSSVPVI